jgi:hypothetical protein
LGRLAGPAVFSRDAPRERAAAMKQKKPTRAEVEAQAVAKGVKVQKTIVGTQRAIEQRDCNDRRAAEKRKQIKDLF